MLHGLWTVCCCRRTAIGTLMVKGPVAMMADPLSATHKKACTCATISGAPGSLCAKTMCARPLRSRCRPRLQQNTQCLTLRTETTYSRPSWHSLTKVGAVLTMAYASVS